MRSFPATPQDESAMHSFRGQWNAAGWGVDIGYFTDVPYGDECKFYAALRTPEDDVVQLQKQHEAREKARRGPGMRGQPIDFDPSRPGILAWDRLFESPNFVQHDTEAGAERAAIIRAIELYGRQAVPDCTTTLGALAAANFGHTPYRVDSSQNASTVD